MAVNEFQTKNLSIGLLWMCLLLFRLLYGFSYYVRAREIESLKHRLLLLNFGFSCGSKTHCGSTTMEYNCWSFLWSNTLLESITDKYSNFGLVLFLKICCFQRLIEGLVVMYIKLRLVFLLLWSKPSNKRDAFLFSNGAKGV